MGEHFELMASIGGRVQRAVVTEIAASLRELAVDGVDLVQDYPLTHNRPGAQGGCWSPGPTGWREAHGTTTALPSS
ncbi:hypothetical protein [Arthrobacter sp. NA-172]|uniref:hypothetical protein n=1 Tax=Arthrobacter sp. NA-172 TaxID=3367524 RepID=UPI0037549ABB